MLNIPLDVGIRFNKWIYRPLDLLFENNWFAKTFVVIFAIPLMMSLLLTLAAFIAGIAPVMFSLALAEQIPGGFLLGLVLYAAACAVGGMFLKIICDRKLLDFMYGAAAIEFILFLTVASSLPA